MRRDQEVSVNNELRVLSRIVNVARERGVPVPPPRVPMLKEPRAARVKVWTAEEAARLLAACAAVSSALVPIVVFLLNTGCRKG